MVKSTKRYYVWEEIGADMQAQLWREKLEAAGGNITKAGESMGFKSKRYAMKLTREHGLNKYAAELRKKRLGYAHGRPWPKTGTSK